MVFGKRKKIPFKRLKVRILAVAGEEWMLSCDMVENYFNP